ncbi:hypothetical protein [Variovorax sp. HW608]|uniref:hypothetical protein n=1 Tax=Variovorax sp. HW608 TaxID=1034889 RepID=UPI000B5ACC31|nr:hypothetical protein [Variovorax sp. HW608]
MRARHDATLAVRPMGIETQQEYVVYIHRDCHVCRSAPGWASPFRQFATQRPGPRRDSPHCVGSDHELHDAQVCVISYAAARSIVASQFFQRVEQVLGNFVLTHPKGPFIEHQCAAR